MVNIVATKRARPKYQVRFLIYPESYFYSIVLTDLKIWNSIENPKFNLLF